jgi:NADH:ubiquinone oxidoreductase subunit E
VTDDGAFTLEADANVGAGAIAPAVRIDTLVYGPVTVDEARHLIYARRADASRGRRRTASA